MFAFQSQLHTYAMTLGFWSVLSPRYNASHPAVATPPKVSVPLRLLSVLVVPIFPNHGSCMRKMLVFSALFRSVWVIGLRFHMFTDTISMMVVPAISCGSGCLHRFGGSRVGGWEAGVQGCWGETGPPVCSLPLQAGGLGFCTGRPPALGLRLVVHCQQWCPVCLFQLVLYLCLAVLPLCAGAVAGTVPELGICHLCSGGPGCGS